MMNRRVRGTAGVPLLAMVVALGCGGGPSHELAGAWTGTDSEGRPLTLVFGEGDAALWITDRVPGVQDTTVLRYRADTAATPSRVDLRGFEEGPLAGMVLYGIYEREGSDTLRIDFEAGVPGSGERPDSFSGSAVRLGRQR